MSYAAIETAAEGLGLMVMGAEHIADAPPDAPATRILLGTGPAFWDILRQAPEGRDGAPDPVDRYSTRVMTALASRFGATADFPFGGPPYAPFIAWARASGRAWPSPTGMLVHDTAGLMISYRGALTLPGHIPVPAALGQSPCLTCPDQPCATACPVGALSADRPYDVPACHGFLDSEAGQDCLTRGCIARRACPVSQAFGRDPAQSAHHMAAFHPT
ncbi:ferredoxin [Marinibacterium profundimaris]|uniref:Ferredoxin n=1 Tax=Marinibacterium profundimaris TaxID=1679460 RepID=A0A225NI69_9RHOB|nr:ferredoxin [Marinibacterium profundimaris]OWU73525.1 ferredoxin [Marinibacterium profundimaris]